jgi:hypothetical protein
MTLLLLFALLSIFRLLSGHFATILALDVDVAQAHPLYPDLGCALAIE